MNRLAEIQLVQGEATAAIATLQQALNLPAVHADQMLRFVLAGTLAIAYTVLEDQASAARAVTDAPRIEGLSRWTEFEHDLVEGYVALARGDSDTARTRANLVAQRAEYFPLYQQTARQLLAAIDEGVPVSQFPSRLWVRCQ
ncbi:MAG TPA: hypothetical protein VFF59_10280 [Anaerolineae bacterium]|nr:hypothetical protein [Anaerolineae bacterium]